MNYVKITDLEAATSAVLGDDAYIGWIGARADKRNQIVVPQIAHLKARNELS